MLYLRYFGCYRAMTGRSSVRSPVDGTFDAGISEVKKRFYSFQL